MINKGERLWIRVFAQVKRGMNRWSWQRAANGRAESARDLLNKISDFLRANRLPSELRTLLADALEDLADRDPSVLFRSPTRGALPSEDIAELQARIQAVRDAKMDHPEWSDPKYDNKACEEAPNYLPPNPKTGEAWSGKTIQRAWKLRDEVNVFFIADRYGKARDLAEFLDGIRSLLRR